ncbi:trigger factor [Ureaplasma miroungigenitalium]|uniref:trigger factor n=1 Tax=Ureaplasma miroungigenitalium TaxID=1042321 RepID=UPI0021E87C18|nr:trigger factor [Ureaplasma miroungigenitalium]MCV3734009.1 trigger factor [Ureaplasma miroungigenitalium]
MQLNKKTKNELNITFEVTADSNKWAEALKNQTQNMIRQLKKKVKIDGFRLGHAPDQEVEKRINRYDLYDRAINEILPSLIKDLEDSKDFKDDPTETLDTPNVSIIDLDDQRLVVSLAYEIYPTITLDKYDDLTLNLSPITVDTSLVDKELKHAQKVRAKRTKKDDEQPIENGDEVVFDFKGSIDNVPFEGGSAQNHTLIVGSNAFIPGFEDQMIGLKANEVKTIQVTFPEDYHATDLAGKKADFELKIKSISTIVLPEINDEFAASFKLPNVNTLKELEKFILDNSKKAAEEERFNIAQNQINSQLLARTTISTIPESMINKESANLKQQLLAQLARYNMDLKEYLKVSNKTEEELNADLKLQVVDTVKLSLVIDHIGERENIKVSEEEARAGIPEMAALYGSNSPETIKYLNDNIDLVTEFIGQKKVMNFLIGLNEKNTPVLKKSAKPTKETKTAKEKPVKETEKTCKPKRTCKPKVNKEDQTAKETVKKTTSKAKPKTSKAK